MADERRTDLVAVVTPATTDILAVRQSGDTRDKRETIAQILGLLVEANDLTAAVVWANIPDANVPESAVTQHEAALAILPAQVTALQLTDNSDVVTAANTDKFVLAANGTTGYVGRLLVEADISDFGTYLTSFTELNDLTGAVVWANIPDANVPESAVTQHEAALAILPGQVTALQLTDNSDVVTAANTDKFVLAANGTTGYVGRLLVEADISDLQAYLTSIPTHTGEVTGDTALALDPSAIAGQALVTAVTADMVLIWDASDSLLKRANVSDFIDAEVNDLTAAVVWANVPQANIPDPLLLGDGSAAAPSFAFAGDPVTGIFYLTNAVVIGTEGVQRWRMNDQSISGFVTSAGALVNETASNINPTNVPNKSDLDTGLGWGGVDILCVIAGSIEALRITEIGNGIVFAPSADLTITAFAGGGITNAVALKQSNNVVSVCATAGDSVKLPPAFAINSIVEVKNDGADSCDVFPSDGDDLGAGTDTAVALAAGAKVAYIATVADATWTDF